MTKKPNANFGKCFSKCTCDICLNLQKNEKLHFFDDSFLTKVTNDILKKINEEKDKSIIDKEKTDSNDQLARLIGENLIIKDDIKKLNIKTSKNYTNDDKKEFLKKLKIPEDIEKRLEAFEPLNNKITALFEKLDKLKKDPLKDNEDNLNLDKYIETLKIQNDSFYENIIKEMKKEIAKEFNIYKSENDYKYWMLKLDKKIEELNYKLELAEIKIINNNTESENKIKELENKIKELENKIKESNAKEEILMHELDLLNQNNEIVSNKFSDIYKNLIEINESLENNENKTNDQTETLNNHKKYLSTLNEWINHFKSHLPINK